VFHFGNIVPTVVQRIHVNYGHYNGQLITES